MTTQGPTELVERLRNAKSWCCIFEHEGDIRHGSSDAPFKAAATIESQQRLIERKDSLLMRFVGTIKGDTLLMLDPDLAALVVEYAALTPSKESG